MAQYLRIKAGHPDIALFYRMGDSHELFYDDAERAARLIDLTLTTCGQSAGAALVQGNVPKPTPFTPPKQAPQPLSEETAAVAGRQEP